MKDFFGTIAASFLFVTGSTAPELSAPDKITWILQNAAFIATIVVAVVTIIRRRRPVKPQIINKKDTTS